MDPNNTEKPETFVPESKPTPTVQSAVPPIEQTVSDIPKAPSQVIPENTEYTQTKSNKLLFIFVFVLIVIFFSLVGLFFYKQYLNTTANSNSPTVQPTVATSPSITPTAQEESELNQIEIPDLNQELQDVQKDTEQL